MSMAAGSGCRSRSTLAARSRVRGGPVHRVAGPRVHAVPSSVERAPVGAGRRSSRCCTTGLGRDDLESDRACCAPSVRRARSRRSTVTSSIGDRRVSSCRRAARTGARAECSTRRMVRLVGRRLGGIASGPPRASCELRCLIQMSDPSYCLGVRERSPRHSSGAYCVWLSLTAPPRPDATSSVLPPVDSQGTG